MPKKLGDLRTAGRFRNTSRVRWPLKPPSSCRGQGLRLRLRPCAPTQSPVHTLPISPPLHPPERARNLAELGGQCTKGRLQSDLLLPPLPGRQAPVTRTPGRAVQAGAAPVPGTGASKNHPPYTQTHAHPGRTPEQGSLATMTQPPPPDLAPPWWPVPF